VTRWCAVRHTLDVDPREQAVEPSREPPGTCAEQAHGSRDENHPDQCHVEERCDTQPDPEDLGRLVALEDERPEHRDHDQRSARDHSAGRAHALDHGPPCIALLQVALPDSAEEEDLVVHREAEEDGEHQHRRQRHDRHRLLDPSQRPVRAHQKTVLSAAEEGGAPALFSQPRFVANGLLVG